MFHSKLECPKMPETLRKNINRFEPDRSQIPNKLDSPKKPETQKNRSPKMPKTNKKLTKPNSNPRELQSSKTKQARNFKKKSPKLEKFR